MNFAQFDDYLFNQINHWEEARVQDLLELFSRLGWSFQQNTMLWVLGAINIVLSLVVIILLLGREKAAQGYYDALEKRWDKKEEG